MNEVDNDTQINHLKHGVKLQVISTHGMRCKDNTVDLDHFEHIAGIQGSQFCFILCLVCKAGGGAVLFFMCWA